MLGTGQKQDGTQRDEAIQRGKTCAAESAWVTATSTLQLQLRYILVLYQLYISSVHFSLLLDLYIFVAPAFSLPS